MTTYYPREAIGLTLGTMYAHGVDQALSSLEDALSAPQWSALDSPALRELIAGVRTIVNQQTDNIVADVLSALERSNLQFKIER